MIEDIREEHEFQGDHNKYNKLKAILLHLIFSDEYKQA